MQKARQNILVAMLPDKQDWDILHQQLWYRIPMYSAPPIIKNGGAEYIAFYHTAKFDANLKWKIIKYAKIRRIVPVTRKQLFPYESSYHQKANKQYYKIEFEELLELKKPFISRRGHRITFFPTTEEKFFSGKTDFNILYNGSPLEDDMVSIIESMDIEYEREWEQHISKEKKYRLDFAIFCKTRNIDIECDGNEFHMGDENVHYDKTRNNELESHGWKVLRYTTKHFKEEREHIIQNIYKNIIDSGGFKKVAEPNSVYFPNLQTLQLRLFQEPKPEYKKS